MMKVTIYHAESSLSFVLVFILYSWNFFSQNSSRSWSPLSFYPNKSASMWMPTVCVCVNQCYISMTSDLSISSLLSSYLEQIEGDTLMKTTHSCLSISVRTVIVRVQSRAPQLDQNPQNVLTKLKVSGQSPNLSTLWQKYTHTQRDKDQTDKDQTASWTHKNQLN